MTDSEKMWRDDAERNGWVMPSARWWKRLPIIRHVRAAYHRYHAERFRTLTASLGLGLGGLPQYDSWVLYGIARGYERDRPRCFSTRMMCGSAARPTPPPEDR